MPARLLGYRILGALLAMAGCAFAGATLGVALSDPDGYAQIGGAITGLFVGALVGAGAGVAFALARPPESARRRWLVLAALAAAALLALNLLELVD